MYCCLIYFPIATSTDVERAFSKGGLTISRFRHSLADESARASTVVGSWSALGVIPKDLIVQMFQDKHRRPKKKQKVDEPDDSDVVIVT
jgi:hypothetical protein